jgi:hypothetical protein
MQYKVSYKDGKSEVIEAASYTVARGTAIFHKAGGGHVAIVSFDEVRSITELDGDQPPVSRKPRQSRVPLREQALGSCLHIRQLYCLVQSPEDQMGAKPSRRTFSLRWHGVDLIRREHGVIGVQVAAAGAPWLHRGSTPGAHG